MSGDFPNVKSYAGWVVGIGASAGGLEAVSQFVANIPIEFDGAVIVAQHLAPHSKSMMVELLSRHSTLPVRQVEDQLKVEPGVVYVVPPNHDLDVVDSHMVLRVADEAIRPKPSVDEFFSSLAKACGEKCIGIVLSGTGSDGSKGIRAIKEVGGITLAQDDQSAKYDGMPRSAVGTGKVDTILPPEVLARNLLKTIHEHENRARAKSLSPRGLEPIFEIIREKLGQDFRQYKPSTIIRRINKRMGSLSLINYEDYVNYLKATPGEIGELAQDLLISVTSFFRDKEVFDDVRNRLFEMLKNASPNQEFRAWIAGCATGEEAYSYAMMLLDIQDQLKKNFPIKIFATDLDHDAIQEARIGAYLIKDLNSVPPQFVDRFFQPRSQDSYELVKRVRDCVVFARQDLIQNPPFVKLDMISCRNVMIYFEPELQKRVLEIFHYALSPSGLLVLGKSESNLSTPQLFECLDRKNKLYEKLNVPSAGLPTTKLLRSTPVESQYVAQRVMPAQLSLADMGYRKLVTAYNIAGVIVDTEGTLIQVYGDVSPYIQFQNQADLRLMNLLPKGVGVEIPILIRRALEDGESHRSRTHRLGKGPKALAFQIVVRPLNDDSEDIRQGRGFVLINFEQKKVKDNTVLSEVSLSSDVPKRVSELEQELYVTKEHLQTVIEELGVSNEELQSLNEELSSTNEELQAANEELETTNEELQSSNEELTTVNEELTAKSTELRTISIALENIQNSIGSPLIVIDTKLRLVRFNTDATKIFYINESDIGRDFVRISTRCEIPDFLSLAKETLTTGRLSEVNCECDGTIYQLQIQPSYDETRKLIGLILVFIDSTDRVRSQEKLTASEERTRAIIEASPSLISLKDNLGRYLLVNSAFKSFFQVTGDIVGKTDREVMKENVALHLRDVDLEVFITRTPVRREETIETADGKKRVLLASRFPLMDTTGRTPVAVGTIAIDITAQVEAQNALQKSETLYRAIAEDQAVLVCRHKLDGHFTYVNEAFAHYFGSVPQSMLKKNFIDVVDPIDRSFVAQRLKTISSHQPIEQHEHRVSRWHTEKRWVRWIHRGLFDAKGDVVEIQSVGFDVTDYQTQTDHYKQKEAVFAGIFDNTSDFITVFRITGRDLILESLNRSAEKILGIAGSQLIGRRLEDFFNVKEGAEAFTRYWKAVETGLSQAFEEEVYAGGSLRHFSTTIVPITNQTGQIERLAAISRDVSKYKLIENDLRNSKHAADVANKAKSDFLASMSHELRTPLNVVLGFCQMLELSQLNPEQRGFVGGIHRSGQLLLGLIEDILDISKIEAGKIKLEYITFSIPEFVQGVIELFVSQAKEKGIELNLRISPQAAKNVIGDPNRLRQILVNFIGNAMKFTSDGKVDVLIDADLTHESDVCLYKFSVIDSGIGIKDSDKSKIFQKFSQAESGHARRFGGSGLGLAISKHLAGIMNGDVGFHSEFGKGSTFWFHVPLTVTKQAPEVRSFIKQESYPEDLRKLKVLVVDDNPDSRTIAELFLTRLGHETKTVESGMLALETLKESMFDIVLMDMQMPEMDGCDTTRAIRSDISQTIPVVALTANAMTEDVERCFESGMNDYLSKPVRLEELSALLNKWAQRIVARK